MGSRPGLRRALPDIFRFLHFASPKLKKEKLLISVGFLTLFCEVVIQLIEPWPLKIIIDHVLTAIPIDSSPLQSFAPESLLWISATALVLVVMLRAIFSYLSVVSFALVGNRVLTEIRNDLYRHIHSLSLGFHARSRTGDVVLRAIGDVGLLKDVAVTAMLPLLGNVAILIGMLGVMFWLNWKLTLLALVIVPLFWLTTLKLSSRIKSVARKQRKREGNLAAAATESISAMKVIQALSLSEAFIKSFSSEGAKSLKEGVKAKRLSARLERSIDVLIGFSTALVLCYGASLVMAGKLTVGGMLVFLFYLKAAFKPVKNFAKYTGRLGKAAAAGDRVLEIFETEPEIKDMSDAKIAPPFRGDIEFQDVTFSYAPDRESIRGVSLQVKNGEKLAIVGESGSGKSTLLALLMRLYDPEHGAICIDGEDIRIYTIDSLRAQYSVVLQDTMLFAASIYDNIAYGSSSHDIERVMAAARLANADRFITDMPKGYDTHIGERGVMLSSGQRQRIAIARAAMRNPPILILDEPTTGLDEENEQQVMDALHKLAHHRTSILVTHEMRHARDADKILFMQNGKIIEYGNHQSLLKQDGAYAAYVKIQLNADRKVRIIEDAHQR